MIKLRSFFQRNFNIICFLWIIGFVTLSFRMLGSLLYLRRIQSNSLIELDLELTKKLDELVDKLQIKRKISAFFSPYVQTPLTLGSFKPVLLFPVSIFTGFTTKEIEAIIAHELAHIMRHDYFFNILQSILEIFFFFNPAVWYISTQIRKERENSCDNIAVEITGDKIAYSKALAGVQIYQMEQKSLAMAFSTSNGSILQRIKRLQKNITMKTNLIEGLIAVGVIVTGLTLVSFTFSDNALAQKKAGFDSAVLKNDSNITDKKYTSEQVDSIFNLTSQNIKKDEELESSEELNKLLEVALSEKDDEISAEMLENINEVMSEIHVDQIVKDAMNIASLALKEAHNEIDQEDIQKDLRQAARDIKIAKAEIAEQMKIELEGANEIEKESIKLGMEAAQMGLNIASSVIENLPLTEIIETSMLGVAEALKAVEGIDFDSVYEEGDLSKDELKQLKAQMKDKEKQLNEQMKQLEKKLKQLDKDLEK